MTIKDELEGKGSAAWRYIQRRVLQGLCDRCGRKLGKNDMRISFKLGRPHKVYRRTCITCVDRLVQAKLGYAKEVV